MKVKTFSFLLLSLLIKINKNSDKTMHNKNKHTHKIKQQQNFYGWYTGMISYCLVSTVYRNFIAPVLFSLHFSSLTKGEFKMRLNEYCNLHPFKHNNVQGKF